MPATHVMPGDVLARLDPSEQEANFRSAKAAVEAAEAQLKQVSAAFERQKSLLASGYTTRRDFDQAQEAQRTAQASLDTAKAQLTQAEDQLSYTVLKADTPGLITARSAETGQVVQGAQPVFTIARDGARDAVFDVDEALLIAPHVETAIRVALASNPSVTAEGLVREIAPTVNANTGTIRVKIGLKSVPPEMTLGAPIVASGRSRPEKDLRVPWNALVKAGGKPAVWIADPQSKAVSLRPVAVARYEAGRVLLKDGLKTGRACRHGRVANAVARPDRGAGGGGGAMTGLLAASPQHVWPTPHLCPSPARGEGCVPCPQRRGPFWGPFSPRGRRTG